MLHGSNRDGRVLLEHWQNLAKQEGIVLAGPDARQKMEWNVAPDGPRFLHAVVEAVKASHAIDPFLRQHHLESEPQYQEYQIDK